MSAGKTLVSVLGASANNNGASGVFVRAFGRRLVLTATFRRMVLPAVFSRGELSATYAGAFGLRTGARLGARRNPRSRSSATFALREADDLPPKTVAIMRLLPRSADATRFEPAARV